VYFADGLDYENNYLDVDGDRTVDYTAGELK
jgi:hypothetical protein